MRSINPRRRVSAFVIIRAADACSPSGAIPKNPGNEYSSRRRSTRRETMPPRSTMGDQARHAEMALPRYQRGDFQREAPLTKSPKGAFKPLPPRRQPPLLASRREMLKPRQAWRRVQRWGPRLRRKNWRHRRGDFRRGWSFEAGPVTLNDQVLNPRAVGRQVEPAIGKVAVVFFCSRARVHPAVTFSVSANHTGPAGDGSNWRCTKA